MISIEYQNTNGFVVLEDDKKLASFSELDHAFTFIKRIIYTTIECEEKMQMIRDPQELDHNDIQHSVIENHTNEEDKPF